MGETMKSIKDAAAEEASKQQAVKENAAKETKTKAECAAKQEKEQMQVRFTLAQDRQIEIAHGWQNFGNGYEGIRLQKQGNICMLSGLIRVATDDIQSGVDKGKKFWHSQSLKEQWLSCSFARVV